MLTVSACLAVATVDLCAQLNFSCVCFIISFKAYKEDIQMFLINMAFISSSEEENIYLTSPIDKQ